ncbi:hypothetical protein ACQJBY_046579 [Aegilops geniculata]
MPVLLLVLYLQGRAQVQVRHPRPQILSTHPALSSSSSRSWIRLLLYATPETWTWNFAPIYSVWLCKGKRRDESNVWLGCVMGREEGNDMEQLQGHTGRRGSTPTPWKVRLDSVLLGAAHQNQPQHDSCHQERQQQEPE